MAGLKPYGVICEIINEDGTMARMDDLRKFQKEFDLELVSVEEVKRYRLENEIFVQPSGKAKLPTPQGNFEVEAFLDPVTNSEHLCLIYGDILKNPSPIVRIQSSCMTSEVFGSLRCDCQKQLEASMNLIRENGSGLLIYLNQEGRGIGLFEKIRAYRLQDQGFNTCQANLELGHKDDERDYYVAIQILKHYGVFSFELLTNNPRKLAPLKKHFNVLRKPILVSNIGDEATKYLKTKFDLMGHLGETHD